MKNWIKNLFKNSDKKITKPNVINSITCGERDENGFANTYVNGEKTNVKLLLWDKEVIEKLRKIDEQIHKENINK